MSKKSVWTQIEEAHNLEKNELGAVVFHSSNWSEATVYGPRTVRDELERPMPWAENPFVVLRKKSELKTVQTNGQVLDGQTYGLPKGKILLVEGDAPE